MSADQSPLDTSSSVEQDSPGIRNTEAEYLQAVDFQLSGESEAARRAYEQILRCDPSHPESNHNLGLLLFQAGDANAALPLLMNAVECAPGQIQFWVSLIEILLEIGVAEHALGAIRQARSSNIAASDEVLNALEQRAHAVLQAADQHLPAAMAEQEVAPVRIDLPPVAEPVLLSERVKRLLAAGEKAVRSAGGKSPHAQAGRRTLSRKEAGKMIELFHARKYKELEAGGRSLVRRLPHHAGGWHFLGLALLRQGRKQEALEALCRAGELQPGDPQLLDHLGSALMEYGYPVDALFCYRESVRLAPNRIGALHNLAHLELKFGNQDVAEEMARRAIEIAPDQALGYHVLAEVCTRQRNFDDAIMHLEQALELEPLRAESLNDLGYAYFNRGELERAIDITQQYIAVRSDNPATYSNYLFYLGHDERRTPEEVFAAHVRYAELFEKPLVPKWRPHEQSRDPERKLRIGFVSGDFWGHVVARFIEPFITSLNQGAFELYGFYNHNASDEVTRRLQAQFDVWFTIPYISDEELANIIRASNIDILIDLSGHTARNRLVTFAYKPAPIQISWIGYPLTTGLSAMDYYIVDKLQAAPGQFDALFTESLIRMPGLVGFSHPDDSPAVGPLPALRNGYMTFASFNRIGKISASTLDLWCQVLHACPDSKMLIGAITSEQVETELTEEMVKRGIRADRLMFRPNTTMEAYLGFYNEVDLVLDTFPYNGGTTTNHAYWMGVPVLSIEGKTLQANTGAYAARLYGAEQFAASDEAEFIRIAQELHAQPGRLAEIRQQLRPRLEALAMAGQAGAVSAGFERMCREVWQRWCRGEAPSPLGMD